MTEQQKSDRPVLTTKGPVPRSSGETVTVACKLPSGLTLRLFRPVRVDVPVFGGGVRETTEHHENVEAGTVTLNGWSHPKQTAPEYGIVGGFALTHGVNKEFFDEWMRQNEQSDVVRRGLIFAHAKEADTMAEAREKKELKSGFERIDPDNLPQQFKGVIKSDDKAAA